MKVLPISENKKFKYSIYFQSFDEESLEMGSSVDSGYEKIESVDTIGDILRLANSTYGIYYPVSFGVWESTEPLQNTEYFEKGIRKYFSLHIHNEDGTEISSDENDFITFLLSDGQYNSDVFEEYAIGGVVLGALLGVGALITYFYFKNKKGSDSYTSTNPRAKSVVRNINGKDRRFPIKDAWRNEHNIENKRENYEVPQGQRLNKFELGGDASEYYHEIEYGQGGVAKAKDIIMNKIGWNENIADYLVSKSEKFAIWLADSILKREIEIRLEPKSNVLYALNERAISINTNFLNNYYSTEIREILDWLQHPLTPKQELKQLSFEQALEKAREWHEELEVLGGDVDFIEPENNFILKKYPKNKEGVEYYWVYIPSNFCSLESSRMGHCGRTGYNNQLISLRSIRPYGKGHTINDSHVTIAYGKEDGLFKQVKGKKNNKPSEKYFPYIFDLIKSASQDGGIEYVKEGMKFDENNKLTVQKEILKFNGFGSEYASENDYSFEDMTDDELRQLFEINPSAFSSAKSLLFLFDKNIISKEEYIEIASKYDDFDTYVTRLELFNRGIVSEKPSTIFKLNYSCGEVDRLLNSSGNTSLVEGLLCGDFDDEYYDNFSYYFDNPSDLVDNLDKENSKRIIDEIVRITNYDESEVIENGINYYLNGEDENFTKDDFDGICRSLANAQNYADRDDYYVYAKNELRYALQELGKIEYLDDRGISIEIDLLDFKTEKEIAEEMDYYGLESISDLFEEFVSADSIDLPKFEIDDRYSPYGDTKVFNDYFSDSDLETYNKGGKLKTKNTIKNNKIKTMNSLDSEFKGGGNVGAISKTKIVITENKEENKIQATRTLVKENSKGEKITYELLVGKHTDKASKPNRYADGWFEIYATDEDDNEYFYSEGGLWLQGNKVVDYDGVGALSEKLRPLMSALNMNSSEVFSQGGAVKSKRRKKRQPKVTRIQFEEGNYEYEGGGKAGKKYSRSVEDGATYIVTQYDENNVATYRFDSLREAENQYDRLIDYVKEDIANDESNYTKVIALEGYVEGHGMGWETIRAFDVDEYLESFDEDDDEYAGGGSAKSKRRKKRQPKVTRIQFEEGNYEYEGGGEASENTFVNVLLDYGFVEKRSSYSVRHFYNKSKNYYASLDMKNRQLNVYKDDDLVVQGRDFKGFSVQGLIDFLNTNGFKSGNKYAGGGGVDNLKNVRGTAYYVSDSSVADSSFSVDNISNTYFDSEDDFNRLIRQGIVKDILFDVQVKNQWNIIQAIYNQMESEGLLENEGLVQIIGFEVNYSMKHEFESNLPYDTNEDDNDEDEYAGGGEVYKLILGNEVTEYDNLDELIDDYEDKYTTSEKKKVEIVYGSDLIKPKGQTKIKYAGGGEVDEFEIYDEETGKTLVILAHSNEEAEGISETIDFNDYEDGDLINVLDDIANYDSENDDDDDYAGGGEIKVGSVVIGKAGSRIPAKEVGEIIEINGEKAIVNWRYGLGVNKTHKISELMYAGSNEYAEGGEVEEWMEVALASLIEETGFDDLEITYVSNDGTEFYATDNDVEYRVFKTEDDAERVAVEQVREDMEETPENFNQDFIAGYVDGRDFFTEALNEMNYSYANDIQTESDDRYENRLIAEMVENGLMDEEDAESGNADELADYYKDDYVSLLTEGQLNEGANGLQHFIDNFGEEEAMRMVIENNLIDIERASTDAVRVDGIAHFLSSYDGETLYLSNNYVAYRIN